MDPTIDDVVERLRAVRDAAPAGDGVATFADVYLTTTEAIRDRLRAGFFADPATVERFDVVFAERFFVAEAAARAGPDPVPRVWEPLFAARADRRVQDVQFAVAGLNAHINHDLALAVVEVCTERRRDPADPPFPADYFRVTDVLVEIEAEVRQSLLDELAGLGGPVEPLLHLVGSWSLATARGAAWVRAQGFWVTRRTRLLHDDLVRVSERTTAMTTRHLLTPLFPAPPR